VREEFRRFDGSVDFIFIFAEEQHLHLPPVPVAAARGPAPTVSAVQVALATAMITGRSPLFGAYQSTSLIETASQLLARAVADRNGASIGELIAAVERADCRRIAAWLTKTRPSDAIAGLEDAAAPESTGDVGYLEAGSMDELFGLSDPLDHNAVFFMLPPSAALASLLKEFGSRFDQLVEHHRDLLGTNSLVRRGAVKIVPFRDGSVHISKRSPPSNLEIFRNDLTMSGAIRDRLHIAPQEHFLLPASGGRAAHLSILPYLAVVRAKSGKYFYVLSEYQPLPTLEEALIATRDPACRKELLSHSRAIVDQLFEMGVIWGDFAPRNILVRFDDDVIHYVLLDFEKTFLIGHRASEEDRRRFARGPAFAEEFSAVCSLSELESSFGDYFCPASWSSADDGPIPLVRPRPEILDILIGRGESNPTFGRYNEVEVELLDVRFVYVDKDGMTRRPVYLNYRIWPILGPDYDRKVTETLIFARRCGKMDRTCDVLEFFLTNYENQILLVDFVSAVGLWRYFSAGDSAALDRLRNAVDQLFESINEADLFDRELLYLETHIAKASSLSNSLTSGFR